MWQYLGQRGMIFMLTLLLMALCQGCSGGEEESSPLTGNWQWTTSQGTSVSFVVTNNAAITLVTAGVHITGAACTAADLVIFPNDLPSDPIVGTRFSIAVPLPITLIAIFPPPVGLTQAIMTGTFATESTASGELHLTANLAPSPCSGTATVTFQARKQ